MSDASWKRNIAIFLSSQTLSLFGSALVQYALMWHITLETKSGIMMTLYIVCGFLPTFFLSPFAGVWADRYDRKKLIILADTLIALVTLAMALVFMAGNRSIPLLFLVAAIRAFGSAIQQPAVGALLPQMVPQESLTRINGINGSIQSALSLVAPMASGALLGLAGIEFIFFIDVATAALAIALLAGFLNVAPHAKALETKTLPGGGFSYFKDMADGFKYIKEHRFLVGYFIYVGFFLWMVTPAAFLTPLQTTRRFGEEVWRLTALEILFSAGMMLGGVAIAAWGGFKNRMKTMVLSNAIMALCTLALGIVGEFWLYLAIMGIFGVTIPFYNTPSMVMIQEHVEEAYMGRVFSVMTMVSTSLMPLGMLVFGPLADVMRIEMLLLATGAAMLVLAVVVLGRRRLMDAGLPKAEAQAPEADSAPA
ncbi:MAG: MFS transporter DHA3 family macrolide efflux protein [Spirochaetes bacterium]|nr:MAG: MFS transporter DHA3 family macrolide efflux protein [Spirochaetota bacterium]